MVMFRDFATRKARKGGVKGLVRNLPDGTVEVVAQGERERLERLIAYLRRGSVLSRVDGVSVEWRSPESIFDSFELVR